MTIRILLFGLIMAGITSCATYREGQTPDDVYYSPERMTNSYVQTDRDQDDRVSYNERQFEDQRLRQQIRDPRFRSFNDDIFWGSPRYNSWGWNTWNDPYNTWGWNNSYGTNYKWGSYSGYNSYGWNNWNSAYICIPGSQNVLVIAGAGAPKNASGIRYSPSIQSFNTNGNNNGKTFTNGSRYFNGTNNSNGTRRSGFFGGGNTNGSFWKSGNSGNGGLFGNNGSSSGGSRTFNNSNSGGSSGSSSGSTKSSTGRRN